MAHVIIVWSDEAPKGHKVPLCWPFPPRYLRGTGAGQGIASHTRPEHLEPRHGPVFGLGATVVTRPSVSCSPHNKPMKTCELVAPRTWEKKRDVGGPRVQPRTQTRTMDTTHVDEAVLAKVSRALARLTVPKVNWDSVAASAAIRQYRFTHGTIPTAEDAEGVQTEGTASDSSAEVLCSLTMAAAQQFSHRTA